MPIAGTTAQLAIEARIAAFKAMYAAFGNSAITGTGPLAAQAPLAIGDVPQLFGNPVFGLNSQPLATSSVSGVGDIQFSAKVNLFDSFHGKGRDRLAPSGFRQLAGNHRRAVRARCTGSLRDSPDNFTGLGTGTHDNAIQAQVVHRPPLRPALLGFLRRALHDADARQSRHADHRLARRAARRRVPRRAGQTPAQRGNTVEFQANPRWSLNDCITLSAHYYFRHKDDDTYTGRFTVTDQLGQQVSACSTPRRSTSGPALQEHRLGLGVAYSTLSAFERKEVPLAMDVTYTHYQTTLGSGGYVPKLSTDEIIARVYVRVLGH